MSAASEKAAREWRERKGPGGAPPRHRWYVCKASPPYDQATPWHAFAPIATEHWGYGRSCATHAEAIAYATEQAREEARR